MLGKEAKKIIVVFEDDSTEDFERFAGVVFNGTKFSAVFNCSTEQLLYANAVISRSVSRETEKMVGS